MVLFLFAAGVAVYEWYLIRNLTSARAEPEQEDIQTLLTKVSKIMVLPADETPEVITISDTELLKSHPFFSQAKIGDKVLIYTKLKKAILYDPVNHKIVDITLLNIEGQ